MSVVFTEDRGSVRHVVLNRPEKRNAMNQELLRELGAELGAAADNDAVHCVVLRGEGRVFSAGIDLGEFAHPPTRAFRNMFLYCANVCEEMTKPVVCQIHGTCVGGALEVALGCDLRVASSDSRLGLPEVKFGVIPDVGGSTRLPALVGLGRAKELIMTARMIDATEAERIGLVNRVVAPHELGQATNALVEELLANSHVAVGLAKRVLDGSARPALAQSLEMEVVVQSYCLARVATEVEPRARPVSGEAFRAEDHQQDDRYERHKRRSEQAGQDLAFSAVDARLGDARVVEEVRAGVGAVAGDVGVEVGSEL